MRLRPLLVLVTAAMLAAPAAVLAVPVSISISIPEIIFEGLGDCIGPDTGLLPDTAGHCTSVPGYPGGSSPPVGINDGINGPAWGIGKKFDQVRFQTASFSGTVDLDATVPIGQVFDFAVGSTGGGSAGPYPGPDPSSTGGVNFTIHLDREIIVNGVPGTLTQTGTLNIDWYKDTLTIDSASIDFFLDEGKLTVTFGATDPLPVDGDPTVTMNGKFVLTAPTAVPVPSTLALLGLGLFGIASRRRRQQT